MATSRIARIARGRQQIRFTLVMHARGIGSRKQADAVLIDGEQRHEVRQVAGLQQRRPTIIKHESAPVDANRQHRVILAHREIANQQNLQVCFRDT